MSGKHNSGHHTRHTTPARGTLVSVPDAVLAPYRGCWVALIAGHVVGVGYTAEAARLAAQHSRPREPVEAVLYVSPLLSRPRSDHEP